MTRGLRTPASLLIIRQLAYDKKGNAFDALVHETKKLEHKKGEKEC